MKKPGRTLTNAGSVDPSQVLGALGIPFIPGEWDLRDLRDIDLQIEWDPSTGPWHEQYVLAFNSIAEAREALPLLTVEGVAKNLVLIVPIPNAGSEVVSPRSPNVLVSQTLNVDSTNGLQRYSVTRISGTSWTKIHSFVLSVVGYASNDLRQLPLNGLRLGVRDLESSKWAVGDSLARRIDVSRDQLEMPVVDSVDLIVQGSGAPHGVSRKSNFASHFGTPAFTLPPVDPMIFSPRGFEPFPPRGRAAIIFTMPGTWSLQSENKAIGRPFSCLNEHVLADLRPFRDVDVPGNVQAPSWGVARMISQLAVAGVPLQTGSLGSEVSELLGTTLGAMLEKVETRDLNSSLRESLSIDIRREALKRFLPRSRFKLVGHPGHAEGFDWPSVSVILATRRPGLIPLILHQIAQQSYKNLEIVLAVHGYSELPHSAKIAIKEFPGELRYLSIKKTVPFGEVLNMSCTAAEGQIITKMDDDDWYSEFHVEDLVLAREYSGAQLVGSPVEFSYLEGLDVTTRRNHGGERYTTHVAGGTIMISKSDLQSVGGWRAVSNAVDRGLIDAVLASGGIIYRTHGQNYVMKRRNPGSGNLSHTWSADYSVFLRDVKEQWDGLVLPPQFKVGRVGEGRLNRSEEYRSIFSATEKVDHAPTM